jgi:hypothetical protein
MRSRGHVIGTVGGSALALAVNMSGTMARAGDGDVPVIGNEAAISGGAVVAAGRSAAMAWANPAGLGANDRARLEASGQVFALRLRRIPGGLRTDLPDGSRSSAMNSRELAVLPSASVLARRLGRHTSAAVALFVPRFDDLDFDVRGSGETASVRFGQQIKTVKHARRYHVGPAFGWQVTSELRLGIASFVVYDKSVQSTSAWARASTMEIPAQTQRFVQADLQESVRSWGAEVVLGLQWQPVEYLHLGLVFRSPRAWFLQRIDRSAVTTTGGQNPEQGGFAELRAVPELDTAAGRPDDPLQVVGGIAYEWSRGWVSLEGDIRPARKGNGDDGRRMVMNARVGVRAHVGERFVVGGGLYTDRSALVVADDFLDFDVDTYGATFGGEMRREVRLSRREKARRLVFTTAVAVRYGLSVGRAGRLRIDLSDLREQEREVLVTTGDPVRVLVHDLALHLGTGLEF